MVYTLGEAAKATGKSKATISKAVKTGKISASKREDGSFSIDPSELHRVYPPAPSEPSDERQDEHLVNTDERLKIKELEFRLELLEERLQHREDTLREKNIEIEDIRDQRDQWHEEAKRAMALLAAPKTTSPATPPTDEASGSDAKKKKRWRLIPRLRG